MPHKSRILMYFSVKQQDLQAFMRYRSRRAFVQGQAASSQVRGHTSRGQTLQASFALLNVHRRLPSAINLIDGYWPIFEDNTSALYCL